MLTQVIRGSIIPDTINFVLEECCNCGIPFLMPAYLRDMLLTKRGEAFYCPKGHSQYYSGKSAEAKLKEQVEDLKKQHAKEYNDMQNKMLDAISEKLKVEKQLMRVHKGVCPCCNRTFTNLSRHMKTKHPEAVK